MYDKEHTLGMMDSANPQHSHYFYVIGLQPRRVIEKAIYGLTGCPLTIMKDSNTFHRVTGNRAVCAYVLIYKKTTAASDTKNAFSYVQMKPDNIFPPSKVNYVTSENLIVFSSPCLVRRAVVAELSETCSESLKLLDSEEIPKARLKVLLEKQVEALEQCQKLELQEEDVKNRVVFKELLPVLAIHGFTLGLNHLEGFRLPVTEYGRSRNDHCVIHKHFFNTQTLKLGMVVPGASSSDSCYQAIQSGNATAGVLEFKNDVYAIDQTIAEMIKTLGDCTLAVLAEGYHVNEVIIAGLSVNYSTAKAKYLKLSVNFVEATSHVIVSTDSVGFCNAINAMLYAIQLQ